MLCQKCGKRTASVHFKQIINGAIHEEYLCSECANGGTSVYSLEKGMEELFGSLFAGASIAGTRTKKCCPLCGATIRDISGSGKVGCAKCYEVFKNELKGTVSGIHGNVHHVGRAPGKHAEIMKIQAEIEDLKQQQQKAVEEQNYELAAELRDKIKALTEQNDGKESD